MPSICNLNISIGFYIKGQEHFFQVKKKKISGHFGHIFDNFFAGNSRYDQRNCNFKEVGELGTKLPNGSYTGVKKMFLERKLDLHANFLNLVLAKEEKFIQISWPCYSEGIHLGQFADAPKAQNADSMALFEYSSILINFSLIGLLMALFFIFFVQSFNFMLNRIKKRQTNLKKLSNFYRYLNGSFKSLTKLNIIMVSFILFLQIVLSMLKSNIQTNEVIVDTSEFIDTKSKLMNSQRYACGLKNEQIFSFVLNSLKNSELYRLLDQRRKPDGSICFLDPILKDQALMKNFKLNQTFFLMSNNFVYFIFTIFSNVDNKKIRFDTSFFEHDLIQIVSLSSLMGQKDKMQLIDMLLRSFEKGLFTKLIDQGTILLTKNLKINNLITSTKSLKEDFIKVQIIELSYFENLNFYLILIYFILFSFFISERAIKFVIKNRAKIREYFNDSIL